MRVRKPPDMENQHLVSPPRQCSSTPAGFGRGFHSKEQFDNTAVSPILLAVADFYLFLRLKSTLDGRRLCDVTNVVKMRWEAEKAFMKWLPGMFPTPSQSLASLYICARSLFWRKCSLNNCVILHSSEIKRFWEHFEAGVCDKMRVGIFAHFSFSPLRKNIDWRLAGLLETLEVGRGKEDEEY